MKIYHWIKYNGELSKNGFSNPVEAWKAYMCTNRLCPQEPITCSNCYFN